MPDVSSGGLPRPLTSFIGRERELGELRESLLTSRALTLCGLVVRRRNQGLLEPVSRAQVIAALLQFAAERQVSFCVPPARGLETGAR